MNFEILEKDNLPIIQNVISTFNIGRNIDLKDVSHRARNSEFNPRRFNGLIMRIRSPHSTALIFKSGKIVCTGTKSITESKLASRKFARIIQKLGYKFDSLVDFKIQNLVASADIKSRINLDLLKLFCKNSCHYEPELFPNLVYNMIEPKVVLLIYTSGKLVITGAKTIEEIHIAYNKMYPLLKTSFVKTITN
jgi:transcription initiation factor TFIID TATA-box-binding protein